MVSKNRRFTGRMKVQVSQDQINWIDTGLELDGWGNERNGNPDIPESRVWYFKQVDISLRGDYSIRWLMYLSGDMDDNSFQIDDVILTQADLPELTPTPTWSLTPSPSHTPVFTASPTESPKPSSTPSAPPRAHGSERQEVKSRPIALRER